ncbi:LysM peptidoglycan-binding domain-containing protein [Acinetobacter larvae]|uniref:LysM domain-containing protein n=1 Tax=Acinetobacter larvae TaxID=1789224 RepID=A0A1B2M2W0_9GAMM|nr:M15 family metallopeptidase [Acinetobacter larvae]AOA59481.1 hypothetical protein BFG52_14750 [Acinetobacter larvae]
MTNSLAMIRFLDALDQPIAGLAHQLWVGKTLISDHLSNAQGESVWIQRPLGTVVDIRVRNITGDYQSQCTLTLSRAKASYIVRSSKLLLQAALLIRKIQPIGEYVRSTYVVKAGDTLSSIALSQHSTVAEIEILNNLEPHSLIYPNQILKIPHKKDTHISNNAPILQQQNSKHKTETPVVQVQATKPVNTSALLAQACGGEKHYQRSLARIAELHPSYQAKVIQLINTGFQTLGITWVITDGYRSPTAQGALAKNVTNAGPLQSYHQYGLAIDVVSVRQGEITYLKNDQQSVRDSQALGPIGEQLGLVWGGRFQGKNGPDYPHFELHPNAKTWRDLKPQLLQLGIQNYKKLVF